mgnify:CR=1 FL=1
MTLLWTAPPDTAFNTAVLYDMRYATVPLDESNFVSGIRVTQVNGAHAPARRSR